MDVIEQELVQIFEETAEAHHKAFQATDGEDPEWPAWYAEHMHEKLKEVLEASFTRSELIYLLVGAENDRAAVAPGSSWGPFYAAFFADRYSM